jgi:hypothetical protein
LESEAERELELTENAETFPPTTLPLMVEPLVLTLPSDADPPPQEDTVIPSPMMKMNSFEVPLRPVILLCLTLIAWGTIEQFLGQKIGFNFAWNFGVLAGAYEKPDKDQAILVVLGRQKGSLCSKGKRQRKGQHDRITN